MGSLLTSNSNAARAFRSGLDRPQESSDVQFVHHIQLTSTALLALDTYPERLLKRKNDSFGGSHAFADLIPSLTNSDQFMLPAMCRSHEYQAGRTGSERSSQGTSRF
jgi:hypothetical protein